MRNLGVLALTFVGASLLAQAAPSPQRESQSLSLHGQVNDVKIEEDGSGDVKVSMKLILEFVNNGSRPIILLRREPEMPGLRIAKTPDVLNVQTIDNDLYSSYGGASWDFSDKWSNLRKRLDKPEPPLDQTRILAPHDTWAFETDYWFHMSRNGTSSRVDTRGPMFTTLEEASPVWMQVTLVVWPFNLEPYERSEELKYKFGHELQRRWQNKGVLWLDEVSSEPIPLNLHYVSSR